MNMSIIQKLIVFKLGMAIAASFLLKINVVVVLVILFMYEKYGFKITDLFKTQEVDTPEEPQDKLSVNSAPVSEFGKVALEVLESHLTDAENEKDQMFAADIDPAHPAYIKAISRSETINSILDDIHPKNVV